MPLHAYRRPRLVVLNADSPVLEAARAMEHNNIGAVFVQDGGRIVGIVTDRDLAVRALGRALDPSSTPISDIMTPSPVALDPKASHADAIRLMQDRNVRRIPLLDGERLVGVVTLDDLLLDEAAPLEELAAIVEAQIGEGGPIVSDRLPARRRSIARAEATLARFIDQIRQDAGLDNAEQARTALDIVLAGLVQRLTPDEASDFISQLPSLLQPQLRTLPSGPDRLVTRDSIEAGLSAGLKVEAKRAGQVLVAIVGTVAKTVSPGEMEHVRKQLPKDFQDVVVAATL
jgi:CBS domain-containing protein/uncharacterized protein (DUF2267 family)